MYLNLLIIKLFINSCSQQESLEEVDGRNGLYCSLLLKRLYENRRIESILMDVATGSLSYPASRPRCFISMRGMSFWSSLPILIYVELLLLFCFKKSQKTHDYFFTFFFTYFLIRYYFVGRLFAKVFSFSATMFGDRCDDRFQTNWSHTIGNNGRGVWKPLPSLVGSSA